MAEPGLIEFGMLLVVASLVAMISRRIGLPYTAGLVLAGIALGFLPFGAPLPLSRELIFDVFLPPLIFEAALQMSWREFRAQLPLTVALAFLGVAISAALLAASLHWLLGWTWLGAAIFGMLIAATDPVSVIAAFKEMRAEPRLAMVVEAESLLNDGVAAVGFTILIAAAGGGQAFAPATALASLAWTVLGGLGTGAAVALVLLAVVGGVQDHLVEITLTTIIAWGGFLLAERIGASGVFAALAAGVIVGNFGLRRAISEEGRTHVLGFWEYAAFLANSFLFLMIGSHEARLPLALVAGTLAIVVLLTLAARAAAVYPIALLFSRSALRLPAAYQHVLVWGGLRGAVALALALAVPTSVPEQREIILLTFGVVAFSVFAQGLTMPPLLRRWRLTQGTDDAPADAA